MIGQDRLDSIAELRADDARLVAALPEQGDRLGRLGIEARERRHHFIGPGHERLRKGRRRVRVVILYSLTELPAIVMIGLWFLFQVISGVGSLGAPGGGVAYGAHVGGFLAGLLLVRLFAPPAVDLARPAVYRD